MADYQRIVFEELSEILRKVSDYSQEWSQEALADLFKPCLKKIGVGIWQRNWFTPPGRLSTGDETRFDIVAISEKESNPDNRKIYHFRTPQDGFFDCIFVPIDEVEVTDELEKCYEYVARNIFIIFGRALLAKAYGFLNTHEDLSGAYNRRYLEVLVGEYVRKRKIQDYNCAQINLKNFKSINEQYGPKVGNAYLTHLVSIMMLTINDDEAFVRLGGDNFVLLFRKDRTEFYREYVLHLEFELAYEEKVIPFKVRMRAGVYSLQEGDKFGIMMDCAGEALRHARLPEYDDFVWFESYMSKERANGRMVIENFQRALKNDEFKPFYQPKVLLETSTLCGAEALCRWVRNGRMMQPAMFIPALEADGSITKLDFCMLEQVCKDISIWNSMGLNPGRVSVNFSKNHLHDEAFADKIVKIIDKYGIDHQNIEIELTETTGFDKGAMTEFVANMKQMDIATSVDDFGTGYSSLNMISGVRTDIVKLDKSFIDGIELKPSVQKSFVKNIVNMINELSMETVAEGVESIDQAKLLRKWDCRVVQGYLYDKPLPMEEFTERLKNPVYEINLDS